MLWSHAYLWGKRTSNGLLMSRNLRRHLCTGDGSPLFLIKRNVLPGGLGRVDEVEGKRSRGLAQSHLVTKEAALAKSNPPMDDKHNVCQYGKAGVCRQCGDNHAGMSA